MRKETNLKHQEALAQWKRETEERLQTVEKEVRNYFEGVVQSLKNQVDDLSSELELVKKELDRTANDYDESLKVRQSLADKVAQLERENREERKKYKDDRKQFEQQLEKLRLARISKEQEFNDLMDVKIALDAEISAYRRILDREETRVGFATPKSTPKGKASPLSSRKRKADGNNSASKKPKRAIAAGANGPSVRIVELDLEKDMIVLENSTDQAIPLKGWEVHNKTEGQVFRFPEAYVMKAHMKVAVFSSKRTKSAKSDKKDNGQDSFWTKRFSWDIDGDYAVLLNADSVPVSKMSKNLPADQVRKLEEMYAEYEDDEAPPAEGVCCQLVLFLCVLW